ncbi:hypothetical protein [Massilia glaciei]|uniref:Uncharacterized protein n=1 Tax=Massilia glaciei TaxID=1524097 RepID=A0A2U2HDT1_9BURK|nr:hypothetical protein [Massilia glaciei]PWF41321.1 hypothetical protein C7C56_024845 [Massilia glaciei]
MTYILNIVAAALPADDAAAHAFASELGESTTPVEPVKALRAFYLAITQRYPCLSDCDEKDGSMDACPWSDAPLIDNFRGAFAVMGLSQRCDEVVPAIIDLANKHGLSVLDKQRATIHRPAQYCLRLVGGATPGPALDALVEKLLPVFKNRSAQQLTALLSGPAVVAMRGLSWVQANGGLAGLNRYGPVCTLEPEAPASAASPPPARPSPKAEAILRVLEGGAAAAPAAPQWRAPEPEVAEDDFSDPAMAQIASGQKIAIDAILLNFLSIALRDLLSPLATLVALVGICALALLGLWRMAAGLGMSRPAQIALAVAAATPGLGLIVLLVMNAKATRRLRDKDYTVGMLGVSSEQIAEMDPHADGGLLGGRTLSVLALGLLGACVGLSMTKAAPTTDDLLHPCAVVGTWNSHGQAVASELILKRNGDYEFTRALGSAAQAKSSGDWTVAGNLMQWWAHDWKEDFPSARFDIESLPGARMTMTDKRDAVKIEYRLAEALPGGCVK